MCNRVHGFSRTQSRIWRIVRSMGFFGLHTVRALPLVSLCMSIFSQLYSFCLLEIHFGVAGELIVVWHCCISVIIYMQCCRRNFNDNNYCISVFMVASLIHLCYIIEYLKYLCTFLYYIAALISCQK
jgi:hypothetical protein